MTQGGNNEVAIRIDNVAGYVITDARLRDLRRIAAIQQASFRPGLAYGVFPLITLRLMPFVSFLVARNVQDDAAIGCVIADRYRGDVRIMNIAVDPDWRRQGVATALLRALAERLPDGDIMLMVEESNRGAQALYQQEGFTCIGHQRGYYGSHRHGIEMILRRGSPRPIRNGEPVAGRIRV